MPDSGAPGPRSGRRRRAILVVVAVAMLSGVLLALAFVPYGSASEHILISPGSPAIAAISIPHAGWVTIHFEHPGGMGMGMHYWMQGSSGMMMDHSGMGGSDSYSFWSWGGTYDCGAGYEGSGSGMMPVWVNATWGML